MTATGIQDSIDKSREAYKRTEAASTEPPGLMFGAADEARREAVRAVVNDMRSGASTVAPQSSARESLHPFFEGLLDTLPPPGDDWPLAKRERWLETARSIFSLLYEDEASRAPIPLFGRERGLEPVRTEAQPSSYAEQERRTA